MTTGRESERVWQLNELQRRVSKGGSGALETETTLRLIELAKSASRLVNSTLGTADEADDYVQRLLWDLEELDLPGLRWSSALGDGFAADAVEWSLRQREIIEGQGIELELGGSFGGSLETGVSVRMISQAGRVLIKVWASGDAEISWSEPQQGWDTVVSQRKVESTDEVYELLSLGLNMCNGKVEYWGLSDQPI